MENTIKAIQGIDFEMLKQQKMTLLCIADLYLDDSTGNIKQKQIDDLLGLVSVIDKIQDAIVRDGFRTKE